MSNQPKAVRTASKAIIIRDNHLLVLAKRDSKGLWYHLPGGGQEFGETLEQALVRECMEEIGTAIEIEKFLYVREFIGKNHIHDDNFPGEYRDWAMNYHSVDFIFSCRVPDDYVAQNGKLADAGQEHVEWLPITSLEKYRLFPSPLKEILNQVSSKIYIGDVL